MAPTPRTPSPRVTGALIVAGIDVGRHALDAWLAHREKQQNAHRLQHAIEERTEGLRSRSREAARHATAHAPTSIRRRLPDWATTDPWYVEHRRALVSSALLGVLTGAAVAFASTGRRISGAPPVIERIRGAAHDVYERADLDAPRAQTAIEAGGAASVAAVDAVASDTSAAATATKLAATEQVQQRVVEPARAKATRYGVLALAGLTLYIIAVSALVQVIVNLAD